MKKLLHLAYSADLAGGEQVILSLIEGLPYQQAVVIPSPNGTFAKLLKKKGITHYVVPFSTTYSFTYAYRVAKIASKEQYDLIISHGLLVNLLGRIIKFLSLLKGHKIKLFNVLHLTHQYGRKTNLKFIYYYLYELFTFYLTDKFICVSGGVKKYFLTFLPFCASKTYIIHNAAQEKNINLWKKKIKNRETFKNKYLNLYKLKNYHYLFITISRLSPQKNLDVILELASLFPQSLFIIVGTGGLREYLEEEIKRKNLENVILTGFRKKAFRYLYLADLLLQPSLWEGFPLTILEAFYLETPVLASNIPGNREAVKHQVTGYLASPKKIKDFSEGINWLLKNKKLIQKNAKNYYLKYLNAKLQISSYQKLCDEVLNEKS